MDPPLTTNCTPVTSLVPDAQASRTAAEPLSVAPFDGTRTAVCSGRLSTVTVMPALVVEFPKVSVATLWRV